jgi:hypothetical protein
MIPNLSREPGSAQVLVRFFARMGVLVAFAAFASCGFDKSIAALLWMSIILCAVIATVKREPPFGKTLNHWDEMVVYAALVALMDGVGHSVPA